MPTDLNSAFAKLSAPRVTGFETRPRISAAKRAFDAMNARARARRRKLVKPENAAFIMDALPQEPDDILHALTPGSFIFCDLLIAIAKARKPRALYLSTLSMSTRNIDALAALITEKNCGTIGILTSNYFSKTNKEIFAHLEKRTAETEGMRIGVARTHAKVSAFDFGDAGHLTIETSANLRSSDNIEQVSIFADPESFEFHREWICELLK